MVTGESQKDQVLEAVNAGASDYLVKPFEPKILTSKLEKYCPLDRGTVEVAGGDVFRASSVMNTNVITIRPAETAEEALRAA